MSFHIKTPNGNKPPDVLYKFREFGNEYHFRSLSHNELFFASPESLNDPHDCAISMDYRLLDTHDKREEYARKLANISQDYLAERGLDPEEEIQKTIASLSSEEGRQNVTKVWRESYLRDVSDFLGVLSLSSNYRKPNLWAYYGANHSGFALGLNRAQLELFRRRNDHISE